MRKGGNLISNALNVSKMDLMLNNKNVCLA